MPQGNFRDLLDSTRVQYVGCDSTVQRDPQASRPFRPSEAGGSLQTQTDPSLHPQDRPGGRENSPIFSGFLSFLGHKKGLLPNREVLLEH